MVSRYLGSRQGSGREFTYYSQFVTFEERDGPSESDRAAAGGRMEETTDALGLMEAREGGRMEARKRGRKEGALDKKAMGGRREGRKGGTAGRKRS